MAKCKTANTLLHSQHAEPTGNENAQKQVDSVIDFEREWTTNYAVFD